MFYKYLVKIFFDYFPQILTYDVILTPKMSLFRPFPPKMTYFDQIDPINDIFHQSYGNKPDWKIFSKFLVTNFFDHFPQILTRDVIVTPKMSLFLPFSPKMTYFDQIDPSNDIFYQSYAIKPEWNNFSKFLVNKNVFDHFPQILTYDVILTPKMSLF